MATLSFAEQVRAANQRALEKINQKCLSMTFQLFQKIIMATPIDKGSLINNWMPQAGSDFSSETRDILSKTGSDSLSDVNKVVYNSTMFLGKDGCFTMTNNLPYAYRIEYEGWSHTKAPMGMVRITLTDFAKDYK